MPPAAADRMNAAPHTRSAVLLLALPPLLLAFWLAGWTGTDDRGQALPGAHADFLWALFTSLPYALAWLAAAWGYGWAVARWVLGWRQPARRPRDAGAIEIGVGVACMFIIDAALGSIGALQLGGSLGAWTILLIGLVLLVTRTALERAHASTERSQWLSLAWLAAAPAIAVLGLAACSAPSWLWRTEFGGYDALSYHLQLPREWLAAGRLRGLEHNVYSFMPSYMEAAYYHLTTLIGGDGVHAAYACQLLHACLALLAAWVTGRVVYRLAGQIAGFAAFIAFIGTPWVIVAGSLAYNEMATLLLLAVGILVLSDGEINSSHRALLAGFLAGAACGAKLTSIGFVAMPLAALGLLILPYKKLMPPLLLGAAAFIVALLPYLLRNLIETGNPVFPFATGLLGYGHFTPDQAQTWSAGHAPGGGATALGELWNQFLRYGIGPNPYQGEPWLPQWSILPWLGIIGLVLAMMNSKLRGYAVYVAVMLLIKLAFWILVTHMKSRFLLPTAVQLSLGVALGMAVIRERFASKASEMTNVMRSALALAGLVLALAWCMQPMFIFANEPSAAHPAPAARVGRIELITGDVFSPTERAELAGLSHIIAINELPGDARTLLVGEAAPFYLRGNITYQTTWDRGPLSRIMREFPDDPEQWIAALRREGFTHLFINESMLRRWERAGWNDPLITAERITGAAEAHAERVQVTPGGVLYRID